MTRTNSGSLLAAILMILAAAAVPAQAGMWTQMPDLTPNGMDVDATVRGWGRTLADDWQCVSSDAVTGIRLWGSWLDDALPAGGAGDLSFSLAIYADVPADQNPNGWSKPGEPALWAQSMTLANGGIASVSEYATGLQEGWYDPEAFHSNKRIGDYPGYEYYTPTGDTICYQYDLDLTAVGDGLGFAQAGTAENPVVYWIAIQARGAAGGLVEAGKTFGWKTSADHWNDSACYDQGTSCDWIAIDYPAGHEQEGQNIDLAFQIIPEPATLSLLGLGGLAILLRRRMR